MTYAKLIVRKNEISVLIRQISNLFGGDDPRELREYSIGVIQENELSLDDFFKMVTELLSASKPYAKSLNLPVATRSMEKHPKVPLPRITRSSRLYGLCTPYENNKKEVDYAK